ncbi:kinase-like domain-containing protein [Gilbertella persicaria]|uniref:Serine/threonine-protein kinase KIN2 n=1 Tax=Rhizopus stolonifer TaxID=4846 RepID=A0A367JVV9_RHIST|nr:kinase-like domain-containing protein [Gilbertella persicaria]KAI8090959.1 kinase-like domain-containing protein [Gilbertella persicaria]RCH93999.1 serine/threonine-protein kinase KIN2 [Rhizopus stolonifer]
MEDTQPQETINRHDRDQQRTLPVKTIGNFTLQQSIGKGSMGKVKLATHNVTGEKIAVKIVPRANMQLTNQSNGKSTNQIAKEKAREENREVRTIREAHIMMLLKHPNIIGMKDIVTQGPYFYILMDYVGGGQLLHYIVKRQRLSDRRTRQFSRQIVSALDYLHRNSIVHRDLKIENIMIDKSGRNIKLIDFGLSNLFCPERQLTTYCGSLYFAAPELLKANPYNGPEVDIWSLGVVIYVMATGSVPFDDKSMPGLHDKIKRGHVTYPAHLSDECKDLLSRIFVTDPAKRIIMTDIINHPWLNKDAAPIKSHMPVRKPLVLPFDPKVIERMSQGFNLGTAEEIEKRLTLIIESPVYHDAVNHIATLHSRKSQLPPLSYNEVNFGIIYDDPQSVPAAYHPFISLYHLAAEKFITMEQEAHHHRVAIKHSLSRKSSVDSVGGGDSSARSSQASLVGADEAVVPNEIAPRLLTDVPTSQTPVMPVVPQVKQGNGSMVGFVSQPAAIASANYLSRIQRWLRSSLSQHHLAAPDHLAAPEIPSFPSQFSAPPSPPQLVEDTKHAEVDTHIYVTPTATITTPNTITTLATMPTPSQSTDDRDQPNNSPNESFHSAHIDSTEHTTHQQNGAPNGSKSLFRKLSQAFLRKNSSRSLNKKTSNLSANQSNSDDEGIFIQLGDQALLKTNESVKSQIDQEVPPPVPPKDINYNMSLRNNNANHVHPLPPGMSIATVTSRQTAHTIDITKINNIHGSSASVTTGNNIPTPIASKMAKYDDIPIPPIPRTATEQPTPSISRSASVASVAFPRRRGSVSKMAGKIGSWLNRSASVSQPSSSKLGNTRDA